MLLSASSGRKGTSIGASKPLYRIEQSILRARPTRGGIRLDEDARFQRDAVGPRSASGFKFALPNEASVLKFAKP